MFTLDVPSFVQKPSGFLILDIWPILSLIIFCPIILLQYQSKRYYDTFIGIIGFIMSLGFHICYLHPLGLIHCKLFGINGDMWRTLDVYFCFIILTRSVVHVVRASHFITTSVSNVIFPLILIYNAIFNLKVNMLFLAILTLCTMISVILLKVLLEDISTMPSIPLEKRLKFILFLSIAFFFLFIPHKIQGYYWLLHSIWHICLGIAFYTLFSELYKKPHLHSN